MSHPLACQMIPLSFLPVFRNGAPGKGKGAQNLPPPLPLQLHPRLDHRQELLRRARTEWMSDGPSVGVLGHREE
jgi:hypothetical protein